MHDHPSSLGAFQIQAELGRGGMGVVYRAHNPALNRSVAIKVIQSDIDDPLWLQRSFAREARVLALLNHPHIAGIYGMEIQDDTVFLVLEFVEGITLAERIRRSPLSVQETASVCWQVVAAIRAAHSAHVIHRDLKPENVMVTPQGVVKVLDFGLAEMDGNALAASKLFLAGTGAGRKEPSAPAMCSRASELVVGTPRYMSPEQMRGGRAREATDIWQLGCIMYECLSGEVAFSSHDPDDLADAITEGTPEWRRLPPDVPRRLVTIIKTCLAKNVRDRAVDLEELESYLASLCRISVGPRSGPPSNLPLPLTSFVGRAKEVGRIRELLADGQLVTIIGVGGTGKTRLCLAAAKLIEDDYPGGTWMVELASVSDHDIVLQQIAVAFGVRQRAGHSLQDCVTEFFKENPQPALLLLDNCEHLILPCAEACGLLLAHCPNVKILASSREALGVAGEAVLQLASLQTIDPSKDLPSMAAMRECESVALFLDRAQDVQPEFGLTERNRRAIAEICHRLDGIPLALELAAARLRMLSIEQIAEKLGHRFLLLTGGSRTALPRQQTLRALIDWSYDLLSDEEKALMRSLSVFRGGWTLAAASHVHHGAGGNEFEMLDTLSKLVDKSLVVVDTSKPLFRYSFLETLRQYSRDRMIEAGQAVELRWRHLQFFHEFLSHAAAQLRSEDAKASLDDIEREHDNLREAMDWCGSSAEFQELGIQIACDMSRFWELRGYVAEGRDRLRSALAAAHSVPATAKARAMDFQAGLLRELGQYGRSMELSEEALEIFRQAGDTAGMAGTKFNMSSTLWRTGRLAEAESILREVLPFFQTQGNARLLPAILRSLSIIELRRGNFLEADRQIGNAIGEARKSTDANALGLALQFGGIVKRKLGDIQGSYRMHEEALSIMIALGARPGITMQLINLGNLASLEEDWRLARQFLETALRNARELGRKVTIAEALGALSDVYSRTGEIPAALAAISDCLQICQESGDRQGQARALSRIAELSVNCKPLPEVVGLYLQSMKLFAAVENMLELGMTMECCGELGLKLGRPPEATQILAAADRLYSEHGLKRVAEVQHLSEARVQRARDELGDYAFEESWQQGRGLTLSATCSLIESLGKAPAAPVRPRATLESGCTA